MSTLHCPTCGCTCRRPPRKSEPRATPQATIDAIMHCVRERDIAALKEPANIERLARCDDRAKAEINRRIAALEKVAA
jgi:hypothetical protein